jgi:cytochrome P450
MQYVIRLVVPGKYWTETFPFLKHIPTKWRREVEAQGDEDAALNMKLIEEVRKEGEGAGESLTKTLLGMNVEGLMSPRAFAQIPGALFGAGIDTTTSALSTFLLALTHPSILSIAQAEIDKVVGPTRSPVLDDEPKLPYITALVQEVLR